MELLNKVKELIEPSMNEKGYILYDLEYVKEGPNYFLRIFISKDGIIDVDDCVVVSKTINPILDDKDLIKDSYILDVCSKESEAE